MKRKINMNQRGCGDIYSRLSRKTAFLWHPEWTIETASCQPSWSRWRKTSDTIHCQSWKPALFQHREQQRLTSSTSWLSAGDFAAGALFYPSEESQQLAKPIKWLAWKMSTKNARIMSRVNLTILSLTILAATQQK